jgi:hypothetical protein
VPEADEDDEDITRDVVAHNSDIEFKNFKRYPKIKDFSKREKL